MLVTLSEAKTLRGIKGTQNDEMITALLLPVQSFIVDTCNSFFHVRDVYVQSSSISFAADTQKITDLVGCDFTGAGFAAGMDVHVEFSLNNDGIYQIKSIADNEITLESLPALIDENKKYFVRITRVKFPDGLKRTAAKMIEFDMNKNIAQGITSESLGDYSASSLSTGDYPASLLRELNSCRSLV